MINFINKQLRQLWRIVWLNDVKDAILYEMSKKSDFCLQLIDDRLKRVYIKGRESLGVLGRVLFIF